MVNKTILTWLIVTKKISSRRSRISTRVCVFGTIEKRYNRQAFNESSAKSRDWLDLAVICSGGLLMIGAGSYDDTGQTILVPTILVKCCMRSIPPIRKETFMQSEILITWSDGRKWTKGDIETSYGDEPLYEAQKALRDYDISESVINDLVDQIREKHVRNGELNLTPGTTWNAAAEGVTLEITAS